MNNTNVKITRENFGPDNRDKVIGYSLYRICWDEESKYWYIFEVYNNGKNEWAISSGFRSRDLQEVIDIFNSITEEKEVIRHREKWRYGREEENGQHED